MNRFLDSLPRAEFFSAARPVSAYRACGVAGFHAAVIITFGATLLTGRSPLIATTLAAVCALSFFLYTWLRRVIAGRECLVLIEHVWFALLSAAAALWALGEPVLPWLDVITPGLCVFLAGGRAGCLLVGCCHGVPSSIGILYPKALTAEGFRAHWVGVRLFPVQAVEMVGLLAIGVCGLLALLPRAAPGQVLAWFLLSYAVMRFGLEGLRGDRRPHLLGLSQARWMSLAEIGAVCVWSASQQPSGGVIALVLLALVLGGSLIVLRRSSIARRVLAREHLSQVREILSSAKPSLEPKGHTTSAGVTLAVSAAGAGPAHVSLALPGGTRDLALLSDLCLRALPEVTPEDCQYARGVLHVSLALPLRKQQQQPQPARSGAPLHGRLAREIQRRRTSTPEDSTTNADSASTPRSPSLHRWYFTVGSE